MTTSRSRRPRAVTTVTATETAKNFGGLVDRVREAGTPYVVERKGRPIVQIMPIARRRCTMADLARWFEARRTRSDAAYADAVRAQVTRANRRRVPIARWRP